jgi:hypothetical protein
LHLVPAALGDETLSYVLQPGSTITPVDRGPTEPLSGRFDWTLTQAVGNPVELVTFDATSISFRSQSFVLKLNTTAANDVQTALFPPSCLTLFGEVVDVTDAATGTKIPVPYYILSIGEGCYAGPAERPIALSYPRLGLSPVGNGLFIAFVNLNAALDSDGDGVADEVDQCPDTPTDAIVDANGCSIHQLVPCSGPRSGGAWKNHGQYVSALVNATKQFVATGVMNSDQQEAVISAAAQSSCGR